MATLAGQKIKDKYGNLLHVEGGATSTLKSVEDGGGNVTGLKVSTTGVEVDALSFATAPNNSASELTALLLDSNNRVVTRDLSTDAFGGSGVFEEVFVGTTGSAQALTAGATDIVVFTTPTNNVDSTSFHFGNAPAQLELDATNREYIENISGADKVVMIDMSATIEVSSPNSDMVYTLQKWNGSAWINIKAVTRYKSNTGSQIDSFWGMFMLGDGERLRIEISSTTGGVSLSTASQFKFTVKETGNIL